MSTTTISIGRNTATGPMSGPQWDRFQRRTEAIVLAACGSFRDLLFTGAGTGQWEGVEEESFTLVAIIDAELLVELQARLAMLAKVFGQEAIAVTAGQTVLAGAELVGAS